MMSISPDKELHQFVCEFPDEVELLLSPCSSKTRLARIANGIYEKD